MKRRRWICSLTLRPWWKLSGASLWNPGSPGRRRWARRKEVAWKKGKRERMSWEEGKRRIRKSHIDTERRHWQWVMEKHWTVASCSPVWRRKELWVKKRLHQKLVNRRALKSKRSCTLAPFKEGPNLDLRKLPQPISKHWNQKSTNQTPYSCCPHLSLSPVGGEWHLSMLRLSTACCFTKTIL